MACILRKERYSFICLLSGEQLEQVRRVVKEEIEKSTKERRLFHGGWKNSNRGFNK